MRRKIFITTALILFILFPMQSRSKSGQGSNDLVNEYEVVVPIIDAPYVWNANVKALAVGLIEDVPKLQQTPAWQHLSERIPSSLRFIYSGPLGNKYYMCFVVANWGSEDVDVIINMVLRYQAGYGAQGFVRYNITIPAGTIKLFVEDVSEYTNHYDGLYTIRGQIMRGGVGNTNLVISHAFLY